MNTENSYTSTEVVSTSTNPIISLKTGRYDMISYFDEDLSSHGSLLPQ